MDTVIEFNNVRSSHYHKAMSALPEAREEEKALALYCLNPQKSEKILEVGAGGGFFSLPIAEMIFPGKLVATDPSMEQLKVLALHKKSNIEPLQGGADSLPLSLEENSFDAIWSGGSFHHVGNKTAAFHRFNKLLKKGGRVVILDVFAGSSLAKHFDLEVAKYCITGHEVSFLSEEFTSSLCYLSGFQQPQFFQKTIQWKFPSPSALGLFLYDIHAMTKTTPEECYKRAQNILGIEEKEGLYYLNWPLTVLTAIK